MTTQFGFIEDVLRDLEKISLPIFLAAGVSDFDCCPWMWREVKNLPKDFTVSVFQHSGHWPHYEEAQLFDERVLEWLRERRVSYIQEITNEFF